MLWKEFAPYAAVMYPRSVNLADLPLDDTGYLVLFDMPGDGVGIRLLKGKEIIESIYTEWKASDLEATVIRFRFPLEHAKLDKLDPEPGRMLYQRLLAPVLGKVPEGAPLVIIPDGALAILPFEALVAGGEAQWKDADWGKYPTGLKYLADIHPVRYCQSLTVLGLRQARLNAGDKEKEVLVLADPVFSTSDPRAAGPETEPVPPEKKTQDIELMGPGEQQTLGDLKFPRFPETERLAGTLQQLYGEQARVLSGFKASKDGFFNEMASGADWFSYLVFATHGVYSRDLPGIMEPAITLTMVPPGTDGFLRMTEVMSLKMQADVVALTGCQTALGDQVSGEGVMSMGRAFQYSGAQSVLITLWSVDETASVKLVEAFFREIRGGKGKLAALANARSEIRKQGYEHPFFWAAFTLVGEGD